MSASNVNNAAGPRQVACRTADNDETPVDLDMLLLSRTFKKMYDDLGLEEHDEFPGVFPVKTVNSRIFNRVIDWCKEHKDEPEPVIEKDPITQECKWFTLTDYDKTFFDVPMPELLEFITAANYLDIPRLYHYACQAIAARIKGKSPREICKVLQQHCDLDDAQIREALDDNPWLDWHDAFSGALIKNPIFIPNEVLVTICQKLPREDLERLQLVSTQFHDVIASSIELSENQGPLRVVAKVELGGFTRCRSQKIDVWLRDGTEVACANFENLAKLLKFSVVQKLRLQAGYGGVSDAHIQGLSALLPVKSAWKNATLEASMHCFLTRAPFEFAFTQLFLCKDVILDGTCHSFTWSRPYLRLPAIAECSTLDISGMYRYGLQQADIVEWIEHEVTPEKKWREPRQMILNKAGILGGVHGLLTALKTAFSASSGPKPYIVRILQYYYYDHRRFLGCRRLQHGDVTNVNEVLANEKTQEVLTIRSEHNGNVIVKRA